MVSFDSFAPAFHVVPSTLCSTSKCISEKGGTDDVVEIRKEA